MILYVCVYLGYGDLDSITQFAIVELDNLKSYIDNNLRIVNGRYENTRPDDGTNRILWKSDMFRIAAGKDKTLIFRLKIIAFNIFDINQC